MPFFIKIAIRHLLKSRLHSVLNLLGLVIGICGFTIIYMHVKWEKSYDTYINESESVFRINAFRWSGDTSNITHEHAAAVPPLITAIEDSYPNLEAAVKIYNDGSLVFNSTDGSFDPIKEEKAYFVTEDFFKVFTADIIEGSDAALDEPLKVLLSKSIALKTFGSVDAVGKTLKATGQNENIYEVIGVFEDFPKNSHFKPHALFSYTSYTEYIRPEFNADGNWFWSNFYTYLKLTSPQSKEEAEKEINKIADRHIGEQYRTRGSGFIFKVQPISDIHLKSHLLDEFEINGDLNTLKWLEIVSYLILIIAWINYINLTAATSVERAKEIGVKKVLGSSRMSIAIQFLTETTLLNLASILLSIAIIAASLPAVNDYFDTTIQIPSLVDILILPVAFLLLGAVASFYPSFVLNGVKLSTITNGFKKTRKGILTRYALLLIQFIAAIGLLFCTLIVFEQVDKLKSAEYGIDRSQIITIPEPLASRGGSSDYDFFKEQVERENNVISVSNASLLPGDVPLWYSTFYFNDLPEDTDQRKYLFVNLVEHDFENVYGLEFVAGQSFSDLKRDSAVLILNETAVKELGESPQSIIGKTLKWRYSPQIPFLERRVIGVIKDYSQKSHTLSAIPMIFTLRRYTPAEFARGNYLVKIQSNKNIQNTITHLEAQWAKLFPNDPFQYSFLDETFDRQFQNDMVFGKLFTAFAILLLIVANIGLFGVSSYTLLQQSKEISIRKVLGAGNWSLIKLTTKNYLRLILLSGILVSPLMYLLMSGWLENFEIRIELQPFHFTIPIALVVVVSLSTILFLTVRTVNDDILKKLRSE
jgi:putative ABC transport system permease protein